MGGENDLRGYDIRSISPVTFIPTATSQTFTFTDPTTLSSTGSPLVRSFTVPILTYTATLPGGDLQSFRQHRIPHSRSSAPSLPRCSSMAAPTASSAPTLLSLIRRVSPTFSSNSRVPTSADSCPSPAAPTSAYAVPPVSSLAFSFRLCRRPSASTMRTTSIACIPKSFRRRTTSIRANSTLLKNTLPPEVYNTQVLPLLQEFSLNPGRLNYFEPKTTFRFTVGKTF